MYPLLLREHQYLEFKVLNSLCIVISRTLVLFFSTMFVNLSLRSCKDQMNHLDVEKVIHLILFYPISGFTFL